MYTWSIFHGVDTFLNREMTSANQGHRKKAEEGGRVPSKICQQHRNVFIYLFITTLPNTDIQQLAL